MKENNLISIVGPTAIGKTAISVELARFFNCDIVSADSRQFYKEMYIGTAVPDIDELSQATHHFIQNRSIFEDYNVGDYERDALQKLNELFTKNPIQIMVGGSGLYLNAVIDGLDDFPKVDPAIRKQLKHKLDEKGLVSLQMQLESLDPKSYKEIAVDNPQRVIRALEICIGTGLPYSGFKTNKNKSRSFSAIKIGLTADREIIYDRINRRVDLMIENGLVDEAERLYPNRQLNALQTVGYRELFDYFDGKITKEFAISEIKKNTRRFAKRQLTWFRRDEKIKWFDFKTPYSKIIQTIQSDINAF